eukprot:UN22312
MHCFFSCKLNRAQKHYGPRHTPNPSPLRNFCVQKLLIKIDVFSEKLC